MNLLDLLILEIQLNDTGYKKECVGVEYFRIKFTASTFVYMYHDMVDKFEILTIFS